MSNLLILFAKAPEPGRVKTRLTPYLSEIEAARLQEAFILDLLKMTQTLSVKRVIACAPTVDPPFFQKCKADYVLQLIAQMGKDLGLRMKNAFQWAFEHGFKNVVIIGCDAPTLPPDFIREGFDALLRHDVVLGPSLDGGYYLIGARRLIPPLFEALPWGTAQILTRTLEILNAENASSHLLPFWYDIDRPQDLVFLKAHLGYLEGQSGFYAAATRKMLAALDRLGRFNP